jgi:hypothetical protein
MKNVSIELVDKASRPIKDPAHYNLFDSFKNKKNNQGKNALAPGAQRTKHEGLSAYDALLH